jgi:hypothetical protein
MTEENKNIKHYSADDIQKYVGGELSAQDMHDIEKAALDDPFLADAIEGFENSMKQHGNSSINADVNDLKKRLSDRISEKRKTRVIAANHLWWQVAAALVILFGAGTLTYNYFSKNNFTNKNIAQSELKKIASDSTAIKNDTQAIQSAPKNDVAVNEKKIEKKESQKIPGVTAKANVIPKQKIADSIYKNKDAVASASIPNSNALVKTENKKDISGNDDEAKSKAVAKNIEPVYEEKNKNIFMGKVLDMNSQPIMGATVNIAGQKIATSTDDKGMFRLYSSKPDSTLKITVNSVGFEPAKAILINDNDIENNTINLHNKSSSLNEVVVTGYLSRKKPAIKNIASDETLKNAEPVIGWKKYKEYLDKNKRISGDSIGLKIIEIVSFTIKKNGKLSNFNIEQSYNDDFDDEAIRLIKKGPAWKLLKNKKARATLTIEF